MKFLQSVLGVTLMFGSLSVFAQNGGGQASQGNGGASTPTNPGGSPNSIQYNSNGSFAGLNPNTSTVRQFLLQTGDGTNPLAPSFSSLQVGDIPTLTISKISDASVVAKTGSYTDLSNLPTIPSKLSQLSNDSGYLTSVPNLDASKITSGIFGLAQIPVIPASQTTGLAKTGYDGTTPISNITPLLTSSVGVVSNTIETLGGNLNVAATYNSAANALICQDTPAQVSTKLTRFRIKATMAGSFVIWVVQENGNNTFTPVSSTSLATAAMVGTNDYIDGKDFFNVFVPANGLVCFVSSAGTLGYDQSTGSGGGATLGQFSYYTGTPAVGTAFTPSGNAGGLLAYTYDVQGNFASVSLENVPAFRTNNNRNILSSGFNFGSGVATSTSTGLNNNLLVSGNVLFGLDKRTIIWTFVPPSSGVGAFFTYPDETSTLHYGSMFEVNLSTNTIDTMTVYGGSGSTPTIKSSYAVPFTMTSGDKYQVKWKKIDSLNSQVTLTDLVTGQQAIAPIQTAQLGYSTGTTAYSDIGVMQGRPGFSAVTGVWTINSYQHLANTPLYPNAYVCGDSIVEGFQLKAAYEPQKWVNYLRNVMGITQVAASGVSGATASGAIMRCNAEIAALRPRSVIAAFGTNGESTANYNTGLTSISNAAHAVGANFIVAVGNQSSLLSTALGFAAQAIVRVDKVLYSGGAGGAAITACYANTAYDGTAVNDSVHPTQACTPNIVARYLMDAPWLGN